MNTGKPLPHYTDNELAQMSSWAAVRAGKALAAGVKNLVREFPILAGEVFENAETRAVKIDFRSQALPRNLCDCSLGKRGQFCAHALAVYFKNAECGDLTPLCSDGSTPTSKSRARSAVAGNASHALQGKRRQAAALQNAPDASMRADGSAQFLAIKLPSRDHPNYADALDLLKQNKFQLDPSSGTWRLLDRHRMLNFLAENREKIVACYGAVFSKNFLEKTAHFTTAKLSADTEQKKDGACEVLLRIDVGSEKPADIAALRAALARGQFYFERTDNAVVLLPPALVKEAAELARKIAGESAAGAAPVLRQKVSAADFADIENIFDDAGVAFEPPESWRKRSAALRNLGALSQAPCSPELQNRLRLYQQIGAAWLYHLFNNKLGGILADEMGLGKTVQAIAAVEAVVFEGAGILRAVDGISAVDNEAVKTSDVRQDAYSPQGKSLIVCPAALVENWCRELARFAPALRVRRHHGQRRNLELKNTDVVVTSYGTLTRDIENFQTTRWCLIIADEAQHIKNRRSQNAKSLRQLRADGRFVLTGTPVENSLDDLRSLFDFLMPGRLSRPPANVARDERAWLDKRTREQAAPYILRRTKQSVAPELPAKIEQIVYCELEGAQAKLYKDWQDRTRAEIFNLEMSGAGENRVRFAAFNQLLRLRQICAEPRILAPEMVAGDSAKLRALREIVDEATDDGHRILLFSQFVEVLKMLYAELTASGIACCYLDGATRDRQAECDKFNSDKTYSVFLISLKAGGVGLNITGADTVIHYDPWWNPAVEAQATDRAHRIGQTKTVTSIKLIAAGTVEERVLDLQRTKANLLRDLFEESREANEKISLETLKELLGD